MIKYYLYIYLVLLDKEVPEMHSRDWQKIPEQITSGQYLGTEDTTKSGYKCMTWEEQAKETFIPWWQGYTNRWWVAQTTKEAKNYCRDPAWENFVWCTYKTSTNATNREECNVKRKFLSNNTWFLILLIPTFV